MSGWWTNLKLRRKGVVVTLIPVVPLVATVAMFYTTSRHQREAQRSVERTFEMRLSLDTVMKLLVDAETGMRGYLLTADRQFLEPYNQALRELPAAFARLDSLAVDPGERARLEGIRRLADTRLEYLSTTRRHSASRQVALDSALLGLLGDGKKAMDRLRSEVDVMGSAADETMARRRAEAEAAQRESMIVGSAAAVVGVIGGLGAALLFTAGISRRVDRLQKHARLLAEGAPLPVQATGADEVAQLDRSLHDAAALLASRERALREAGEEIDRFFALSLDLQCLAGFDGSFKRVNAAWTDTLGWTQEELLAQPYLDLIHPDDRTSTSDEAATLAAGQKTLRFENRYRTKQGTYRWLEWRAFPVVERGLIYASARDITDQKAAAQLLQDARQEADRANRAKSTFLSRMSHDLRTPLNAVLGFAQLLENDSLSAEQRDGVKQILRGGRHLLDLINEVLELARIESGRLALSPELVSVDHVVQEAVDLIRPLAAERAVAIEIDFAAQAPEARWMFADRQRIRQVLLNLLSNGVKYNRRGGRLRIAGQALPGGRCRISVSDTGAGIRPEHLQVIFQPFERLGADQTATEGTGLGLSVAKGLVEAMGGTIGVESAVDQGTTFWFDLARADAPENQPPEHAPDWPVGSPDPDVRGTVLYIEDNPSNRQLMQHVVARRPGIRLLLEADAEAGLATAAAQRPDLILLDLHLPGMSGEDALRHLWANPVTRTIPVAILSADATHSQRRRLLAAGAFAYLTKPIDVSQVLDVLDQRAGELGRRGRGRAERERDAGPVLAGD